MTCFFFFFSSRRRHTRSLRDWSSDVCSSDLTKGAGTIRGRATTRGTTRGKATTKRNSRGTGCASGVALRHPVRRLGAGARSEERRVGKECRSRWWTDHEEKNRGGKERQRRGV